MLFFLLFTVFRLLRGITTDPRRKVKTVHRPPLAPPPPPPPLPHRHLRQRSLPALPLTSATAPRLGTAEGLSSCRDCMQLRFSAGRLPSVSSEYHRFALSPAVSAHSVVRLQLKHGANYSLFLSIMLPVSVLSNLP